MPVISNTLFLLGLWLNFSEAWLFNCDADTGPVNVAVVSCAAKKITGKMSNKKKLSFFQEDERSVATGDEFSTGAGFIKQKYVSPA